VQSLGESSEGKEPTSPHPTSPPVPGTSSQQPTEIARRQSLERRDSSSSITSRVQVPLIKGDVGRNTSRDFFSNMSSELNGLASQTSSMFSDFFGGKSSADDVFLSLSLLCVLHFK